ncbi:M61 family metallopeptidase [Pontibacter qinzhouensis]|uniref:M61 family metallopeptidase n=1 Tax=Pontibacter qinzhouensis TaxID=2603253 RepID=A0A5C8JJQ2_9BACT|nr:M61 family metallopeptidase [Pontibacter qinzhouensis]TXK36904.1 M61 family metallopeptidase [Pontibacter qinzhouensis]
MIYYHISYTNPLSHLLTIRITISDNKEQELYLQLPSWRPGRYELQNFAQKLSKVSATANGAAVTIKKVTKDKWLVENAGAGSVVIEYSFYARQMDAGGSWLDEQQLYLNPINCLMAVEGRKAEPCQLQLALPDQYEIACGLQVLEKFTLQASDYHELVDAPLFASDNLQQTKYEVNGLPFYIWIQGDCQPDWLKIKEDFEAFTKEQLELFGDFPVSEYHFLNQILPYRYYHGVEHGNSTVITLGPAELLMSWGLYKEFVGVSSHELFHTWNIKKIRPVEMLPYDYAQENYFRTGYIAEGITTYYGDYLLARSGFFTAAQYFEELNTTLQRYYVDYGHHNLSVADSSFDLWLDGYKAGIPDRKVSIYVKGALTALLLDLQLRKVTDNRANLDQVLVRLWNDFGKQDIGYSEQDYERLVQEVAGSDFTAYFENYIYGTTPIEEALTEALQFVGCTLQKTESQLLTEQLYGFKTVADGTAVKVTALAPGSPASQVLSLDDELIALNGRKLEQNLQPLLSTTNTGAPVAITLFRDKRLRKVHLQPNNQTYYSKFTIEKRADATGQEQENFRLWLKQEF